MRIINNLFHISTAHCGLGPANLLVATYSQTEMDDHSTSLRLACDQYNVTDVTVETSSK